MRMIRDKTGGGKKKFSSFNAPFSTVLRVTQASDRVLAILRVGDRPKPFLPGRVPDLQLHPLTIDHHCAYLEVHADGRNVASGECVVRETNQQRGLADA